MTDRDAVFSSRAEPDADKPGSKPRDGDATVDAQSPSAVATSDGGPSATASCIAIPEICDGHDNDCDGQVDSGARNECGMACGSTCVPTSPACVPSTPAAEICDGKDNDCNGQVDEEIADGVIGSACTEPPKGHCVKKGINKCVNGAVVCDGQYTLANLLQDPGFEQQNGYVVSPPWTNFKGASIELSGKSHSGSKNAFVPTTPGTTAEDGWNEVYQRISVEPNTLYKLQAWVKTSANTTTATLGARSHPSFGTDLGFQQFGALSEYTLMASLFMTGTENGADVYIGVLRAPDGSTTTLEVDDVTVTAQAVCF